MVSGNVQLFDYGSYADQYLLDRDPTAYAEFAGERLLMSRAAVGQA
ncbi:MAG: hypothetical protein SYR96_31925 [Actinomycetota bacterium]|nr:hypothetical protein [Actinomycetota bacterium]